MLFLVATTSLPAVNRLNAYRWNATCSCLIAPIKSSTDAWESKCPYQLSVCIITLKMLVLVSFYQTHFRSSTGAWESKYQYWISVWIIILKIEILVSFDSTPFNYSTGSLESKYQYQLSVCIIILKIKILGSFECTHLSYPLVFENQNVNINYLFVLPSWKLEY